MKKATCPITKEPMDCKVCKYVDESKWCPLWDVDKFANDLAEFTRKVMEMQNETRRD